MRIAVRTVALGLILLVAGAGTAFAQAHNPFGVGISEGGGPAGGIVGWILAEQIAFERGLSAAVRAARGGTAALPWLTGLSFAYGLFHAAGPGHGKVVIASYLFANTRALKRGLLLTLLAALLQGLVAIGLVGVLALALHATAGRMRDAAAGIESASFAGVACLGAWLTLRKGLRFAQALRVASPRLAVRPARGTALALAGGGLLAGDCGCGPGLRFGRDGARAGCGHVHAPDPARLGRGSWTEAGAAVLAAGLRPCSGAILVLVFALAQGLFGVGVLSVLAMSLGTALTTGALAALAVLARGTAVRLSASGTRGGAVAMRGLELGAALLMLVAGVSLFLGYTGLGGA